MAQRRYATMDEHATKWGEAVYLLNNGDPVEKVAEIVGLSLTDVMRWWALRCAGQSVPVKHTRVSYMPMGDELQTRMAEARCVATPNNSRRHRGEEPVEDEYQPRVVELRVGGCAKRRR